MKRFFLKLAILLFVLFSFSNLYAQQNLGSAIFIRHPSELDSKQIPLDCKWDYFDSVFFDPEYFYTKNNILEKNIVERGIKKVELPYPLENGQGYATYHCRVENLKPNQYYGIRLYKFVYGAADVYVNGKAVYLSGATAGKNSIKKKALRHMRPVIFSTDEQGVCDIVLHVSNYDIAKGGVLLVPHIATAHYTNIRVLQNITFESLLAGILIILALYNLVIFLLNKSQKMYLFLSILSFDFVFVSITLGFSLISYLIGDFTVANHFKMVLFFLALIIPLYNLYAIKLYGINYKWNWIALFFDFAVALCYLFLPIEFVTKWWVIFSLMAILYLASIYLCVIIHANEKSSSMLYSFNIFIIIILLLTALYGLLVGQYISNGSNGILVFKIAIMCFAICQSSLAGIKRDLIAKENKVLVQKYEKLNSSYKRFVPQIVTDFFQKYAVAEVSVNESFLCDGMILYANIRSEWKQNNISEKDFFILLNDFYTELITVAKSYKGFFEKKSESTFSIIFTEKTDRAVRCAITIQKYIEALNKRNSKRFSLKLESAIHSLKMAIGFIGNEKHLSAYSCSPGITDVKQICTMNKPIGSQILITEQALDYCRNYIDALYEGVIIELAGMKTLVYKVIPFDKPSSAIELLPGDDE